jgi:hypothetical protein
MRLPSFALVEPKLRDWLDQVNAIPSAEGHPMEVARAHVGRAGASVPDGNGRTGRLLLNLILARLGYPPAIIQSANAALPPGVAQSGRRNDGPLAELTSR